MFGHAAPSAFSENCCKCMTLVYLRSTSENGCNDHIDPFAVASAHTCRLHVLSHACVCVCENYICICIDIGIDTDIHIHIDIHIDICTYIQT